MRQAMPSARYTASRHIPLAAIFLVLLSLCAASPVLATDSVISRNTAFARETLALINAERQKAGYTLMAEGAKLNAAAKERLAKLFRSFGNKRPGGRGLAELLRKYSASFLLVAQSNGRGLRRHRCHAHRRGYIFRRTRRTEKEYSFGLQCRTPEKGGARPPL